MNSPSRLFWILEMKRDELDGSETKKSLDRKRDLEISKLRDCGFSYSQLCSLAKKRDLFWQMVS